MEPFKNEKRTEGTSRPRPFASLQDALRAAQPSAGRLAARHAAGDGVALEPKVAAVIASFEDLFVEETFDPASLVREFRIACADHAMFYIGPAVTLASRTAPGVTFRLSPNGDDWVVELQKGDLDFLNNLATEVGGLRFSRGFSPRGCPRFAVTPTTKSLLTQPLYGKGRNPPPSEPPELALGDPFSGLNDYDTGVKPGCYSG